jgi:ParB-like chromosome segregation protein Spo0J
VSAATGLETGQRQVALSDLHESTTNPRTIEPERLEALKRAMQHDPQMLEARPLIALTSGEVIAGNMRLRAANALGWETIETYVTDLPPERAREWMLRDNNPYGEFVDDQLARLIADHERAGGDVDLLGFEPDNVSELLKSLEEGEAVIPDAEEQVDPELKAEVMVEAYMSNDTFSGDAGALIEQLANLDGVEVNISS